MPAILYSTFRKKLLKLYQPPQRAQATYQRMAQVLDLVAALGVRKTSGLTQDLVSDYVCSRPVRANTVIGELGYLKAACNWAEEEGYLTASPFRGRRKRLTTWIRPGPPRQPPWHSQAEICRLFDYLSGRRSDWKGHRLWALTAFVALTSVRRDEALYAQIEDLDWHYPVFRVMGRQRLKTLASAAPVPICDQLAAVLREWMPHAGPVWLFPGVKRKSAWDHAACGQRPLDRLAEAGKAVGIQGLTFQSLRHSWATHAESAWGLQDALIARCMRHTTTETSRRRYRHADLVNLARAVKGIGYVSEPAA